MDSISLQHDHRQFEQEGADIFGNSSLDGLDVIEVWKENRVEQGGNMGIYIYICKVSYSVRLYIGNITLKGKQDEMSSRFLTGVDRGRLDNAYDGVSYGRGETSSVHV